MIQVAERHWPAALVHDTVDAVMRTAPFRRSVRTTLLGRLLRWLAEGIAWLVRQVGGLPSARTLVIGTTLLVAALVLARAVLVARARRDASADEAPTGRRTAGENPWRAAERLAAAGDHEGAAHALYRGVLAHLALREQVRLDAAKTSGDYGRELRARHSGAAEPFRRFARRFDGAVYGHAPLDAALVAELTALAGALRDLPRAA